MKSAKGRNKVLVFVAIALGLLFVVAALSPALAQTESDPEIENDDQYISDSENNDNKNGEPGDDKSDDDELSDHEYGDHEHGDDETNTDDLDTDDLNSDEIDDENSDADENVEEEPSIEMRTFSALGLGETVGSLNVTAGSGNKGVWNDSPNRRLGGADRFETAVKISKDTYPNANQVKTVIVATGFDFPDSLSAAPLGAKLKAPLLLTTPKTLSPATKTEIQRLKPDQIIIIGQTGAVSKSVENALKKLVPKNGQVVRVGGSDRYDTSLLIAKFGWKKSAHAFTATGADFPDALSAGAAAANLDAPVILVPGMSNKVSSAVKKYLQSAGTTTVHIAGGTGVVSSAVATDLGRATTVKTVKRYHGPDRFETSAQIAKRIFGGTRNTYWANAFEFPDALTGATAAGAKKAALLLTMPTCVPNNIYDVNDSFSPADTVVLGGPGALKAGVRHGNECMRKPANASAANWKGTQQIYAALNKERYQNGKSGFRVSDWKVGTPAYSWSTKKSLKRNGSLKKQQPWVSVEAVARSSASSTQQVNGLVKTFSNDTKTGIRNAIYRDYGGSRAFVSVGYQSGAVGYATVYVGRYP